MSEISNRLYAALETSGYSYGELSKLTGIPKSALQRYATGETEKIPLDRLEKMANALGVSSAYLMGWEDQEPTKEEIAKEHAMIIDLFDRCSPESKRLITAALQAAAQDLEAQDEQ